MLDFLEILARRSFFLLAAVTGFVGLSYYFGLEIVRLDWIDQIRWHGEIIDKQVVGTVLLACATILTAFGVLKSGWNLYRGLLEFDKSGIEGVIESELNFDSRELLKQLKILGPPPAWPKNSILLPTPQRLREHDMQVAYAMAALDRRIGYHFYSEYKDIETKVQLYVAPKKLGAQKGHFYFHGFGRIQDRLLSSGSFAECGLIISSANIGSKNNIIRLQKVSDVVSVLREGLSVTIEFEQLVHPFFRYPEFRIYLQFKIRRRLLLGVWEISQGVYYLRSVDGRGFIPIAHTHGINLHASS